MPNVKGAVLTDRDRALLAYVGIARYASADQVHRLIAPDRSKKLVYRRLAKLCLPGGRPGEGACLRRLHYRRSEGTRVPVWALTPYGRSLVSPDIPWLPAPESDVGARFLEHTLLLNGVLLELVVSVRRSETAPLADLPFRWRAENDEVLQFRAFGHRLGETHQAVLKPDAILEVPGRGPWEGRQDPIAEVPEEWQGPVATGPYAVMREGEIFGLRKEDVDLKAGVIMVCRSWDTPRTKDGKALPVPIADQLRPRMERALRESPGPLVFPKAAGSTTRAIPAARRWSGAQAWRWRRGSSATRTCARASPGRSTPSRRRPGLRADCARGSERTEERSYAPAGPTTTSR